MLHPRGLPLSSDIFCLRSTTETRALSAIWHSFLSECNNRKESSVLIESSMYHMYCETTRVHRDPLAIVKVTDWPMVEHSLD